MTTGFALPFTVRSTIRYATGLEHVLLLLTTPMDDVTSYFTFVVWRNDDGAGSAEEVVAFDRRIGQEDQAMLERIPSVLALEGAPTVSVPADRPSLAWRRQFVALLRGAARHVAGQLLGQPDQRGRWRVHRDPLAGQRLSPGRAAGRQGGEDALG